MVLDIASIHRKSTTKERILYAAAMMFAKNGYENVSVRDLADEVNVRAPSLYNHFTSKKEILHALYSAYNAEHMNAKPDIDELLRLVESEPPMKVLMRLYFFCDPDVEDLMSNIFVIASQMVSSDADSAALVKSNLFDLSEELWKPVLKKMIRLGKIEPIDADALSFLVTMYGFGGAALQTSNIEIDWGEWPKGYALLCSLVKTV